MDQRPEAPGPNEDGQPVDRGSWGDMFSHYLSTMLVLAGGVLLYAMNLYFTATLLPSIVADIGGVQYYAWVTTGFVTAAIVASMFVSRFLSTRGAAGAYVIGFVIFGLGTVMNALSPAMEFLVAGRVIQGFGGGLLSGLGYTVVRSALPQRLWTRGLGLISAMFGVGTLLGPMFGGLFAQFGAWRWAYGAIALVSVLLIALTRRALQQDRSDWNRSVSVPVVSLVLLVLASISISVGSLVPVGWPTLVALGAGVLSFAAFVMVERQPSRSNRILPALVYRRRSPLKWIYLTVATLCAAVMVEAFVPRFGQELGGLNPLLAGFLGAVLSLGWTIAQLAVVSVERPGLHRLAIRTGPALLTVCLVTYGFLQMDNASSPIVICWAGLLFVAGLGVGAAYPLLQVAAISSTADPVEGSKAAAAISTTQLIAFAAASAFGGTLIVLGGDSSVESARYLIFGISAVSAIGIATSYLATRKL